MINILIVDDEEYAIDLITNNIDFQEIGIDNIFKATSPLDAITILLEHKIDILLTDIYMNDMNGVLLAEKAVSCAPGCRIIFISAYSEKEYLMSAIKLKVLDYIEKPFDIEKIEKLLKKTVTDIRQEKKRSVLEEKVTDLYNEILPYLRQQLALVLTKRAINDNELYKSIVKAGLTKYENSYALTGLIRFVRQCPEDSIDIDMIENIGKQLQIYDFEVIYSLKNENVLVLHFLGKENVKLSYTEVCLCLEQIMCLLPQTYKVQVSLGSVCKGLPSIYESYQSAVVNLEASYVNGYKQITYGINESGEYDLSVDLADRLINEYRKNARENTFVILQEIYLGIKRHPFTPIYKIRRFYTGVTDRIIDVAESYSVTGFSEERREALHRQIERANVFDELHELLCMVTENFFDNLFPHISSHVSRAMQYIGENFCDESISIESVSQNLSITQSYLCMMFKKETGVTINKYISGLRMEKAKDLLRNTNLRVDEIVRSIGYIDVKYFFKIFKKYTGMTPIEYRKGK